MKTQLIKYQIIGVLFMTMTIMTGFGQIITFKHSSQTSIIPIKLCLLASKEILNSSKTRVIQELDFLPYNSSHVLIEHHHLLKLSSGSTSTTVALTEILDQAKMPRELLEGLKLIGITAHDKPLSLTSHGIESFVTIDTPGQNTIVQIQGLDEFQNQQFTPNREPTNGAESIVDYSKPQILTSHIVGCIDIKEIHLYSSKKIMLIDKEDKAHRAIHVTGLPIEISHVQLVKALPYLKWRIDKFSKQYFVKVELRGQLKGGDPTSLEELSYKGIFTTDIYNLEGLNVSTPEGLLAALKKKKKKALDNHVKKKISTSTEMKKLLNGKRELKTIAFNIIKGLAKTVIGRFTSQGAALIDENLPNDNAVREKLDELKKKIIEIELIAKKLDNGLDRELISELENEYILKKHLLSPSIQKAIEQMLISFRDTPFDNKKKITYLTQALLLPTSPKSINRVETCKKLLQDPYFNAFDSQLIDRFLAIITSFSVSSRSNDNSGIRLRDFHFLHGAPGTGKTSAVKRLARLMNVPIHVVTIKNRTMLNPKQLLGSDNFQSREPGLLAQALMTPNQNGERFTNGILLLDDFDKYLFNSKTKEPQEGALAFLNELCDRGLNSMHNTYFNAEIPINRLSIFITSNTALPNANDNEDDPYNALRTRLIFSHFNGFSEEVTLNFGIKHLTRLAKEFGVTYGGNTKEEKHARIKTRVKNIIEQNQVDGRINFRTLQELLRADVIQVLVKHEKEKFANAQKNN